MKKVLKILVLVLVAALICAQFFRPNRVNPPVVPENTLEASTQVPNNVKAIIDRSCGDCHSNNTVYPWYSNITPVSWFLADHIKDGRREMNFSEFNTYSPKKKAHKMEEICEQIEAEAMPLPSYLWLHRDAVLSKEDGKILCDWAKEEKARIGQ